MLEYDISLVGVDLPGPSLQHGWTCTLIGLVPLLTTTLVKVHTELMSLLSFVASVELLASPCTSVGGHVASLMAFFHPPGTMERQTPTLSAPNLLEHA